MFMLYLDASGTSQPQDASKHYVLMGVAVHENTWFALNHRIRGLKKKYAYPGEDFELHCKDFCISIKDQDKIQRFEQMNHKDRRLNVLKQQEIRIKDAIGRSERDALRKWASPRMVGAPNEQHNTCSKEHHHGTTKEVQSGV